MKRETENEFGSRSFVFPQMQIEKMERKTFGVDGWRPGFVDYLSSPDASQRSARRMRRS